MAYQAISTNSTPAATLTVTAPASIADGDILIGWVISDNNTMTCTPPSGFNAITGVPITVTADGMVAYAWVKKAASESGDYVFTATHQVIGGVARFNGRHATDFLNRSSVAEQDTGQASGSTIASAAYGTVTDAECDIFFLAMPDPTSSADMAISEPTNFTERVEANSGFYNYAVSTRDAVGSGFDGVTSCVATGATFGWAAISIALATAGGGGGASGNSSNYLAQQ